MEFKDLIGKTVFEIIDKWDGENNGDSLNVKFTDGTILTVFVNRQPGGECDLGIATVIHAQGEG